MYKYSLAWPIEPTKDAALDWFVVRTQAIPTIMWSET